MELAFDIHLKPCLSLEAGLSEVHDVMLPFQVHLSGSCFRHQQVFWVGVLVLDLLILQMEPQQVFLYRLSKTKKLNSKVYKGKIPGRMRAQEVDQIPIDLAFLDTLKFLRVLQHPLPLSLSLYLSLSLFPSPSLSLSLSLFPSPSLSLSLSLSVSLFPTRPYSFLLHNLSLYFS